GVRGVGVFNNELFVGMHSPPQIWKTADGLTWQKVFDPTEGKGKGYIASMAAWDGHLYTGVNLHAPEPSDVFRTADGMTWEEAGELTPYTIEAMEVFQGDLFAGVLLPSGAWIYRSTKGP
ncbi:MAG TPA: hypothetical protein VIU33_04505, partial [Nitrospiria bacterium]